MSAKNIFLIFMISLGFCVIISLSIDLKADLIRVVGISMLSSIVLSLLIYSFGKPLRRWFRMAFDKNYKYNGEMPIIKKQSKDNEMLS